MGQRCCQAALGADFDSRLPESILLKLPFLFDLVDAVSDGHK